MRTSSLGWQPVADVPTGMQIICPLLARACVFDGMTLWRPEVGKSTCPSATCGPLLATLPQKTHQDYQHAPLEGGLTAQAAEPASVSRRHRHVHVVVPIKPDPEAEVCFQEDGASAALHSDLMAPDEHRQAPPRAVDLSTVGKSWTVKMAALPSAPNTLPPSLQSNAFSLFR